MAQHLTVLITEHNPVEAELLLQALREAGFEVQGQRVETEPAFLEHLHPGLDLVLANYRLPQFDGLRALELLQRRGWEIPLIIISGVFGEEAAVGAMKRGATDYLLKDHLARLGAAVTLGLAESQARRERRRAEEALKLFRSLIDQSNDILEIIEPETGRILDVSGTGPAILGYTREEYLSLRVCDVDPTVTAESWPQRAAKIRAAGALAAESSHRRKDGTAFPVEFNAKWVRLERDYIVTVVRDISRRQEAEQALRASEARFRQLAENIDEVFWITDPTQSRVLYVSPAYERVWGRTCESLYAAPPTWRDAIHPQDRARVILATGERQALGTYREEYRILRPDGSERWVRDRAFPVRDADGALQRIVGIAEDITEQRKIQERFLRAQRMEAIGTLASGIAHDLNNILGPLLMVPALLREYAKSDRERQLLDVVARGAQRSSEIVRQLLTFSRGSGGERVSVQFRPLFKEMTAFMKATFPGNIIVEQRAARDLRPVLGDPTQLQQVLMNLCVNARDAMPHGGKLSLAAKNVELSEAGAREHPPAKPGPYVTVTITDTGEGIDPEIVGRIFEPFFTTKPANKGTGLGLSTAQGIVRSHQGFISVVSKPGLGTSFTLYIPAAAVVSEPVAAPATDAPPRGQGELILVVDDEASLVTTTRLILEWNGYRVVTASNGGAAIAVFLEHREKVRVVLTDVSMPVMGGGGFDTGPAGPGPQGQGARHHRAGRRQHSKRTAGGRRQRISAKTVRPARTA